MDEQVAQEQVVDDAQPENFPQEVPSEVTEEMEDEADDAAAANTDR